VVADHLIGSERRLAACPQADQQAGDDGAVGLNLDAIFAVAQQLPASQNVLEESEENLSVPIIIPPKITLLSS
ncbi:MAG: hypothetical protein ACREMY_01290, partial [bacterium]